MIFPSVIAERLEKLEFDLNTETSFANIMSGFRSTIVSGLICW